MLSNDAKDYISKLVKREVEALMSTILEKLDKLSEEVKDLKVDLQIKEEGENI